MKHAKMAKRGQKEGKTINCQKFGKLCYTTVAMQAVRVNIARIANAVQCQITKIAMNPAGSQLSVL